MNRKIISLKSNLTKAIKPTAKSNKRKQFKAKTNVKTAEKSDKTWCSRLKKTNKQSRLICEFTMYVLQC